MSYGSSLNWCFTQEAFDPVTPSAAEQEEDAFVVWIQSELVLYNGCQAFHTAPEIRIADSQIDLPEPGSVIEHRKGPHIPWKAVISECFRSH